MNRRHAALLLAFASFAIDAAAHYDPVALHNSALDALRGGDTRTASILVERAALLAPRDPRIQRTLRDIRAVREGRPSEEGPSPRIEDPAPAAKAAPEARPQVAPEPPPAWPHR